MKWQMLAVCVGLLAGAALNGYADAPGSTSKPAAGAAFKNPCQPVEGYDYKSILYNFDTQCPRKLAESNAIQRICDFTRGACEKNFPGMKIAYSEAQYERLKDEAAMNKIGFAVQVVMPNPTALPAGYYPMTQQIFMLTKKGWLQVGDIRLSGDEGGVDLEVGGGPPVSRTLWAGRVELTLNPIRVSLCKAMLQVECPLNSTPPAGQKQGPDEILIGVKSYLPFEATDLEVWATKVARDHHIIIASDIQLDAFYLKLEPGVETKFFCPRAQDIRMCDSVIVLFGGHCSSTSRPVASSLAK